MDIRTLQPFQLSDWLHTQNNITLDSCIHLNLLHPPSRPGCCSALHCKFLWLKTCPQTVIMAQLKCEKVLHSNKLISSPSKLQFETWCTWSTCCSQQTSPLDEVCFVLFAQKCLSVNVSTSLKDLLKKNSQRILLHFYTKDFFEKWSQKHDPAVYEYVKELASTCSVRCAISFQPHDLTQPLTPACTRACIYCSFIYL